MDIILNSDAVISIREAVTNTVTSLAPLIALVVGVPLAFYVARKIISLIPKK